MRTWTTLAVSALALAATAATGAIIAGCKKKGPEGPVIVEGWHQEEGWKGACYFPKDYKDSDRLAANDVRNAMMSQWKGERDDGVSFSTGVIEGVETVLLGKPDAVKSVARQNLDLCKQYMAGGSIEPWQNWFAGLEGSLTQGDCKWPPLRYQQHDYLDLGKGWQFEGRVCKGDVVRIEVSSNDYYRLADDEPWINGEGDTSRRAVGEEYPCTLEDCFHGTVIYRFTGEDGTITIGAVGLEKEFVARQAGILELRVNADDSWYDNVWRKKGSLIDHSAISYIGQE